MRRTPTLRRGPLAAATLVLALALPGVCAPALAQAYDPGPPPGVPGSSVSGMRIGGAPKGLDTPRIPGAPVFGDTVEERVYGRGYDDSYLHPKVPGATQGERSTEDLAIEGRSDLNGISAGTFARQGSNAAGRSAVTRSRSTGPHRAIIRRKPHRSRRRH